MSSKENSLYGIQRHKRLQGDKEIASNTTLSFSSQLGSLIGSSTSTTKSIPVSQRLKPKKEDLFHHANRNTAKRAKRDHEDSPAFATHQKHTTNGESLDRGLWERSKRKMEEKARLYAAMKRGDVEDVEDRYGVDFDRKWAEAAREDRNSNDESEEDEDEDEEKGEMQEMIYYEDEFGRTRTGTRAEAAQAERLKKGRISVAEESDRFTARPAAPSNVIYGDTIQHHAFNPDAKLEEQMEALAKKRDKSLTPPPEEHFDASKEVRTKGTGFFQFSEDAEERKRQMEGLEKERAETERMRRERGKRKADAFLDEIGLELDGVVEVQEAGGEPHAATQTATVEEDADDPMIRLEKRGVNSYSAGPPNSMAERIEAAIRAEVDDDDDDPMVRLEKRALSS